MGYDRNDRGIGRDAYGSPGYGADRERGYRARPDRDFGRERGRDYNHDDDRGFFDRAGDEVRSWFGDEDAERRRRADERDYELHYRDESRDRGRGWRDERGFGGGRVSNSDYDAANAASYGVLNANAGAPDRARSTGGGGGGYRSRHEHDPHYREWRDRQMESLDRDYDEYSRENQTRFGSEFGSWRQNRQTQRDSLRSVVEHQEVVGSDGSHIGTVDHVRGDRILLTKTDQDAGGHHHSIPSSWIRTVGDKIELSKTAEEAKHAWREERQADKDRGPLFGGGREGRANLDRSFSGTY